MYEPDNLPTLYIDLNQNGQRWFWIHLKLGGIQIELVGMKAVNQAVISYFQPIDIKMNSKLIANNSLHISSA